MFGCCNNLFSNSCRCNRCSCGGSGGQIPIFPPLPPTPTPTPTPTQQLRGMEVALTGAPGGTVPNGGAIPFNQLLSNTTLGGSFTPGATGVTLNRAGTYLVNWWVAVDGNPPVEKETEIEVGFSVNVNGSVVSTAYAGVGTGQIAGSAVVTVTSAPAVLSLVNASGASVCYADTASQAGMTVMQLA